MSNDMNKNPFYQDGHIPSAKDIREQAIADLVVNFQEDILGIMSELKLSPWALAKLLSWDTRTLKRKLEGIHGEKMTLSEVSEICLALGLQPRITLTHKSWTDEMKKMYEQRSEITRA